MSVFSRRRQNGSIRTWIPPSFRPPIQLNGHRLVVLMDHTPSSIDSQEDVSPSQTTVRLRSTISRSTMTSTISRSTMTSSPLFDYAGFGSAILGNEEFDEEVAEILARQMSRPTRRRVDIIKSTMNPMVEQMVADAAVVAINRFDVEKEYCRYIKQFLDMQIGPYFHCICGRRFGAYVSASSSWSFTFRIEQYTFLVFRSNDLPLISRTASESSESRSSSSHNSHS